MTALVPGDRFTRRRGDRWPDLSAIPAVTYLLRDGDEVVYVGYSTKIRDRLTAHRSPKVWDSAEIIACASVRAAWELEGSCIRRLRPRHNVQTTHHGKAAE